MLVSNRYFDKLLNIHGIKPIYYGGGGDSKSDKNLVDDEDYDKQVTARANELFRIVRIANSFGSKLSNMFKTAFNQVSETSTVLPGTVTYQPIQNGIDLTFGGGFMIFDSTFNFLRVTHVYYKKGTTDVTQIIKDVSKTIDDVNVSIGNALLDI